MFSNQDTLTLLARPWRSSFLRVNSHSIPSEPSDRPIHTPWIRGTVGGGVPLLIAAALFLGCDKRVTPGTAGFEPSPTIRTNLGAWGTLIDPLGGVKVEVSSNSLAVTVPAGIRDLSGVRNEGGSTAPRVLQDVEGDFVVSVKVTGDFDPPRIANANAFNGAGILVFASEDHFLRLERNLWTTPDGEKANYTPLFEYWHKGEMLSEESGAPAPFFKGRSTHLRLERRGAELIASMSHDGSTWEGTNRVTTQFPSKVGLGVCAINTAEKPLRVEFSEWTLGKAR